MAHSTCPYCGKNFSDENALKAHIHSVHPTGTGSTAGSGLFKKVAIAGIIILVVYGLFLLVNSPGSGGIDYPQKISDTPMHIHPLLYIYINSVPYVIPTDVGIGRVHQPLHTHDDTGTIHVESTDTRAYTLGNFFQVWGKKFDSQCLMDYCTGSGKTLTMLVDGQPNTEFGKHVLRDGERIELVYK